jgi:hypothetical protein
MKKGLLNILVLILFLQLNKVNAQFCTGTTNLTASSGTFSDGSGVLNYNNATNCSWLIQPNGATSITLTFQTIDVEVCCDFVSIYDGANASAPLLGTYSGTTIPAAITSSGGIVFVSFTSNASNTAQGWTISYNSCSVPVVFAMPDSMCIGGTSQLNVVSSSLIENFDPINASQWTILNGTVNNTCGAVTGNALYFNGDGERSVTSIPLNVSNGGSIDFNLKISNGTAPCEQADAGEEVVLEYSIDNALTWVLINTYNTGGTYSNFTSINVIIPPAAQSNSTLFKWRQISNSGLGFDNWALDNIEVNSAISSITYNWSPSIGLSSTTIANPTASPNVTTTYTVIVSDANCSESSTVTVHIVPPTQSTINTSGSTNFCQGDTVTLTANPGLSYLWSNGATSQSIDVIQSGNYSVAINYGNGCNSSSAITSVVVDPLPSTPAITVSGSPNICNTYTVALSTANNINYSYQWNNNGSTIPGAQTSTYNAQIVGEYTVTIVDNNSCSATSAPLNVNDITPVIQLGSVPSSICAGATVPLSVTSGIQENFDPISPLNWNIVGGTVSAICGSVSGNALYFNGSSTRTLTSNNLNLLAGGPISFSLKISNGNAPCEQADANEEVVLEYSINNGTTWSLINTYQVGSFANFTTVNEIIPPAAQTTATQLRWRQLSNSGLDFDNWSLDNISIQSSTGGAFTYAWSPATGLSSTSISNPLATVNATTTYTVTVSDGTCSKSASITLQVAPPTPAIITASGSTTVCVGDTITLTANQGISYLWSTGDTTQSILVAQTGSYSVAIDYGFACNSTSAATNVVFVPLPAVPTITISGSPTVCDSSIVVLSAPTAPNYTYQWSKLGTIIPGAQSSNYNAQTGGEYSVTVINNNGCSATSATVTINELTPSSFTIAPLPALICAGATVQLDVLSGIQENFDPISPLNWNIVGASVSDSCGSVSGSALYFNGTSTRTLTSNNLNLSTTSTVSFSLKISNGVTPCEQADAGEEVVLEYSINNGTTWTIINTYQVGNFANFTNVNEQLPVAAQTASTMLRWRQLSNSGYQFDNWSLDNINILFSSATNYNYLWSPAAGLSSTTIPNPSATVNATTTYTLTVSSGSCAETSSVTISVNPATQAVITANNATNFCAGGTVTLTANTGLSYLWSTGDTTQSINVTQTGNYDVAIDYGFACNSTSAATNVTVFPLPSVPTITNTGSASLCNGSNITLNSSTGSNYTYQWSNNGNIIGGAQAASYTTNNAGVYSVTVSDVNNCSATSNPLTITDLTPYFTVIASPPIICSGSTVQLNVSTGLIENFDPINVSNLTISGGTVSDSCGAVSGNALYFNGASTRSAITNNINFSNGGNIAFDLKISNDLAPCEAADTGEEIVLEYSIDNGITWTIINTYFTGNTYANFTTVNLTVPIAAQTAASKLRWRQISNSGVGYDNWALDNIQIENGATNLSYNWTPVQGLSSTSIANPTSSLGQTSTYTVVVTASGSCTATGSVNVVANSSINITTTQTNTICDTCCTGSATASITGGLAPFNYVWSPAPQGGQGTATATGLCSGNYQVTVTDSIGCSSLYGVFISTINGINEAAFLNNIAIYPNPTKGNFTLKRNADLDEKLVVQFMNALGEEIFVDELSATTSSKVYEIEQLSNGIYFVRIQNARGDSKVIRVVKN